MSKSYGNTIGIFEKEASLRKKVMSLKTDSTPVQQPKHLEQSTILALYKLVASLADYALMEDQFRAGGVGYGEFKKTLFAGSILHRCDNAEGRSSPIQAMSNWCYGKADCERIRSPKKSCQESVWQPDFRP